MLRSRRKNVENTGSVQPIFRGARGVIPQILDMHFQIALISENVAGFG